MSEPQLSGTKVVSRLALSWRAEPVELTQDWSCLWNRATRSTQMGWEVLKQAFRRKILTKEKRGKWGGIGRGGERMRNSSFLQFYFFILRKREGCGVVEQQTKFRIWKYPSISIDLIHPFLRKPEALVLLLTKALKALWKEESRSLSAASFPKTFTNMKVQQDRCGLYFKIAARITGKRRSWGRGIGSLLTSLCFLFAGPWFLVHIH